jgi:hypothetical protein
MIFVQSYLKSMEKRSKMRQFDRFYIVTHLYFPFELKPVF